MMKQDSIEVYVGAVARVIQIELIADITTSEEERPAQRGSIVNCASVNSIQAGAGTSGYTASKHAVMGITKTVRANSRRGLLG